MYKKFLLTDKITKLHTNSLEITYKLRIILLTTQTELPDTKNKSQCFASLAICGSKQHTFFLLTCARLKVFDIHSIVELHRLLSHYL